MGWGMVVCGGCCPRCRVPGVSAISPPVLFDWLCSVESMIVALRWLEREERSMRVLG